MRKLGNNQIGVLRGLYQNGPYPGSWRWENHSTTVRILNGLVTRGFVETYEVANTRGPSTTHYRITEHGRIAYRQTKTYRREGA